MNTCLETLGIMSIMKIVIIIIVNKQVNKPDLPGSSRVRDNKLGNNSGLEDFLSKRGTIYQIYFDER